MKSTPYRTLSAAVLAVGATLALAPAAAMAVPPPNDDFDSATVISSLPFTDSLSTIEATTASDDPSCAGNGHTVWYSFTPSSDINVEANTFGSDYDTTISAYTGSRGSLSQVACNDDAQGVLQSQINFVATGGTTYHFMVGSFDESPGGNLQLTVQEAPPPPEISLSLDRRGFVDRQGVATVSGSVSCDQPLGVDIGASLSQTFARRFTIQGFGGTFVDCQPPSVRWEVSIVGSNGRFTPGRAHLEAGAFGCNAAGGCASDQQSADIKLRGGR